ncbi:MAG TPA: YfhO family protein, partial [Candidatus Cloacimonadota bacterium]|nr:YfhO family protein [Candidatus Cloacimonadota bacterium]
FGFTLLAVMNPFLSTMEYSHYTMRGGSAGLDKAYAQSWSFHPLEIIGFIIPDFFGGINNNYWGYMPFTQIYNYFGLVVLALGFFALMGRHKRFAIFLWISSALFTIMSFGEFAPFISDLLLKYLPYFNKFRVPSMILIMTQIIAVILAALGMDNILSAEGSQRDKLGKLLYKLFWICGGLFVAWLLLSKSVFRSLPFVNDSTLADLMNNYKLTDLPEEYKLERLNLLFKSGTLSLLFLTVSLGLAYLYSVKKLGRAIFVWLITIIIFIDLWIYTGKHLKEVEKPAEHLKRFEMTDYDQFLLQDKTNYRIYPFNTGRVRPAGEWAYYHQTIDGYSAAKLKRYDDILKIVNGDAAKQTQGEFVRYLMNLMEKRTESSTPVLDMLNAKYILIPDSLPGTQFLNKIDQVYAGSANMHVFKNNTVLPRAWFVKQQSYVGSPDSILSVLQRGEFDPSRTALVETADAVVSGSDSLSVGTVEELGRSLHKLEYRLQSPGEGYLVLSEVYYPAGWKAILDGKEIPIYATNYILRGLKIPSGEHKLELVFAPDTYKQSLTLSMLGILLTILAVVGGGLLNYKKRLTPKIKPQD